MQLDFPFMSENTTPPASTETPATASLTLADIQSVINLIDIVSARGAFKGPELCSVGTLRDTFERFLKVHAPKAPPADTDTPAPAQD